MAPHRDAPFLASDPPHWIARGLWYWLASIAVTGIAALLLVRVPETVSGRFTLVPERGSDPIRVRRAGVVTDVRGVEGARVDSGATLFVVHSSTTVDRGSELRSLLSQSAADSIALRLAHSRRETRRREDESEHRRLLGRIEHLERRHDMVAPRHALARELADSAASGLRSGAISRVEVSRMEFEAGTYADQLEETRRQIAETREDLARLAESEDAADLEYAQIRIRLDAGLAAARARITALRGDLAGTNGNDLMVTAPCTGTLLRLHIAAAGAIVQEGDALADIGCDDQELFGELVLPESGVPLVRPGQSVRLRLDAFPYQRFGVRFGEVRWLGPAGTGHTPANAFRALIELRDSVIIVDHAPRPLLAGMGGHANVLTGRRRLISFVFEPIRSLRERFAEPPK
jgi:membrane fusion protein